MNQKKKKKEGTECTIPGNRWWMKGGFGKRVFAWEGWELVGGPGAHPRGQDWGLQRAQAPVCASSHRSPGFP